MDDFKTIIRNRWNNKKWSLSTVPSQAVRIVRLSLRPKLWLKRNDKTAECSSDIPVLDSEVANHDASSFPPPAPSVLIINPGIVRKRRRHFQKEPQRQISKKLPLYPFDLFFDYNEKEHKHKPHLRDLRVHKLLGKQLGGESRNFYSLRILRPRLDDTPLRSLYRMYEYVVVDDTARLRQEVEYFYNMTDWQILGIPDPADEDPLRYAILAVMAELLLRAFNGLFKTGLRRNADVWGDDENRTKRAIKFYPEKIPDWVAHVPVLGERAFLPNIDGDILMAGADDPLASPDFLKYNIIRRRPRLELRYFEPKGKIHRPGRQVLTAAGHSVTNAAAKIPPAVSHAVVGTGKSTAHGAAVTGKWTGAKALHACSKCKKTGKYCVKKEAVTAPIATGKKFVYIWTTGTKAAVRSAKVQVEIEDAGEAELENAEAGDSDVNGPGGGDGDGDEEANGNDKGEEGGKKKVATFHTEGNKERVVHRLDRDVYLIVISYGAPY